MSDAAVDFLLEQLEPSAPPPRDSAERLLAEARAEALEIREQARAEGYEQGRAAGLEAGRAEVALAGGALVEAAAGVAELRDQTVEAIERDAIDFGLALARKILPAAVQARPELVVVAVQGALRRVTGQRTLTVLVAPEDLATVREALREEQLRLGAVEPFDLVGDQRVKRGGAIVRTADGEVDMQVQTQLQRAAEVTYGELSGAGPDGPPANADTPAEDSSREAGEPA